MEIDDRSLKESPPSNECMAAMQPVLHKRTGEDSKTQTRIDPGGIPDQSTTLKSAKTNPRLPIRARTGPCCIPTETIERMVQATQHEITVHLNLSQNRSRLINFKRLAMPRKTHCRDPRARAVPPADTKRLDPRRQKRNSIVCLRDIGFHFENSPSKPTNPASLNTG